MRTAKLAAALLAATTLSTAALAQATGTAVPGNSLDTMFPNRPAHSSRPAAPPPPIVAPIAEPRAAQPVQAPRPAPAAAQAPTLPPFLAPQPSQPASQPNPMPPPMSVNQVLSPPAPAMSPAEVQAMIAPTPPPTPAREITISDNETSEKIESLNRQKRILDAEYGVEKARVEVAKQLTELRKAQGENRPTPTPAQIIMMQQAQQPVHSASVAEPDPARELSSLAQRMSVISISGPREALRATISVSGFGEVRAVQGGTLPGGLRIASITDQGVAVTRGSARPVLLQFSR